MDSKTWDNRYAAVELVWGKEPNRFLERELAQREPEGRVLDLACGEGRNAIWLASRGWEVTAVDFSPVAIDRARRLGQEAGVEVDWVVADILGWRAERRFSLALLLYFHAPPADLRKVLGSAVEALAPGGELLLIGHARRNLTHGTGGPQNPTLLWEPAELATEVRAAGAGVLECEHRTRPVQTDQGTKHAVDTVLWGRRGPD